MLPLRVLSNLWTLNKLFAEEPVLFFLFSCCAEGAPLNFNNQRAALYDLFCVLRLVWVAGGLWLNLQTDF